MPTKRCRSCLRFGRRKLLDPAPPRLVNTASIERPVFIEINPAGVLRSAAPILYAWSSRAALGRGTTRNDTTMHGQHRRYRLLSRHIPSSRCQSNRQILAWRNPCLFEVWTFGSAAVAVWWSQTGSNRRPPACKAGALPTELWPRLEPATHPVATFQAVIFKKIQPPREWWAWKDLNFRPHAYQARALTN